jgi:histidinol-phosphate aminotransferase
MRTDAPPPPGAQAGDLDLTFHGDQEVAPGLTDLAVNVRAAAPPSEAMITAGAAEAFTLISRAFTPRRAVVVHPQFTEPEATLRAAGHQVDRVILDGDFMLDPASVPGGADLVVIGNPTNPTSVLHPASALRTLARPGRLLVVDEAFADCVLGEPESLTRRSDLPGLVVVRSLTKTWGLAGLRIGYVLADAQVLAAMAAVRPPWAVSAPALAAAQACCQPAMRAEAEVWAQSMITERAVHISQLNSISGVHVVPGAAASFLLLRVPGGERVRPELRAAGEK